MITATYSPDDNKLRIYPMHRLDQSAFARVKGAGYVWAPKQKCFVAPMWTPGRADIALELAGEIEDEDRTLLERAEDRADRFDGYSTNRAQDADRARAAVRAIGEHIPMGQPILIGHHSEAHARRHAERIERGMERAVKAFETAEYWAHRAAGAIAAAKYKEQPDVRARRIKTIEADRRKIERNRADLAKAVEMHKLAATLAEKGKPEAARLALGAASTAFHLSRCFTLADYPRQPPASQYEDTMSLWSAVDGGIITYAQAAELAEQSATEYAPRAARWLEHYDFRLAYERAMLAEQTGQTMEQVMAPAPRRKSAKAELPLLNCQYPDGTAQVRNPYNRGETLAYPVEAMTRAGYARISADYKGTRISADGTHRVRTAMRAGCRLVAVFLTDSKAHPIPTAA